MNDNLEKTTSPEKLWKSCLLYIKDKISDQAFQTWFSGILISSVSNDELVIQVPNKFHFEDTILSKPYKDLELAVGSYFPT